MQDRDHSALAVLSAPLSWLGRQGTRAIATLVFIGIAVPPLGAVLKPLVPEAIFVLLCIAFVRVNPAALRSHFRRPGLVIAAAAWTMLAVPMLFGLAGVLLGLRETAPDLFLGLMLQAAAPPMMAAPAFAAAMGFDAALVLAALIGSSALTPLTAPVFVYAFAGPALTLSPLRLGITLFGIIAGSAIVAAIIRRVVGAAAIERHKQAIDGFNIIVVFVFVAAVMGGLAPGFADAPVPVIGLAVLAFATCAAVLGLTAWVFRRAGGEQALMLGMMTSQRNMGLMLAATGGALPDLVWLYFAVSQLPIYLSPQLLKPLATSLARNAGEGRARRAATGG
jgi:BASS family bile acid:Na+ symporter